MNNAGRGAEQHISNVEANDAFVNYFQCATGFAPFRVEDTSSSASGFFCFRSAVCYGITNVGRAAADPTERLFDAASAIEFSNGNISLCFNPTEVVENLRRERYSKNTSSDRLSRRFYYSIRPAIPFYARKLLQRSVSRSRRRNAVFPRWPVDCSVEQIFELLMEAAILAAGESEIPFIWFWPDGNHAAVMMTHDVEEANGAAHCEMLMDLDDSFGVKSAFQLVPEGRYDGFPTLVASVRSRGFETNIHDLDHDGRLYDDVQRFQQRAQKINHYARMFGMRGFRAGAMHRNQDWFDLLEFQYEMSVPNVSHLEPQKGGCCTVTPYFVGDLLELPLTTVQDHGLFYILGQQTIDLWKQQIEMIYGHHGLISFIVHPDYIVHARERRLYRDLLTHLQNLKRDRAIWWALPGEINEWWRQRSQMTLVREGDTWQIQGKGSERARIGYAAIVDGQLVYRVGHDANVSLADDRPGRRTT